MQTKLFSKRTNLFLLTVLAGLTLLLATWANNAHAAPASSAAAATSELSDAEVADLLFMREEEKLAHDVYLALYDQWGVNVFQNIAASEQTHSDTILYLIDTYDLVDPVGDNAPGVFVNQDLQALYTQLVIEGGQSLADALRVGAAIEEIDILDLDAALARTDHADILVVYQNLRAGSENHLRAFVNTLQRLTGQIYTPQYMDPIDYADIINGTSSQGNGQGRRGGGNGNGRGYNN